MNRICLIVFFVFVFALQSYSQSKDTLKLNVVFNGKIIDCKDLIISLYCENVELKEIILDGDLFIFERCKSRIISFEIVLKNKEYKLASFPLEMSSFNRIEIVIEKPPFHKKILPRNRYNYCITMSSGNYCVSYLIDEK
jgi:hypothetical protein